jgi:hypothetical protein
MGFTQIGLEMMLLLGFQAVYGYVYHQLAIVIAGFMAGMALGSWLGLRSSTAFRLWSLVRLQLVAAASGLALCGLLAVSHLLYPILALLAACWADTSLLLPAAFRRPPVQECCTPWIWPALRRARFCSART